METTSCIRCGRCVGVCPETLVPQLMAQAAVNKDYERFENYTVWNVLNVAVAHMYALPKDH